MFVVQEVVLFEVINKYLVDNRVKKLADDTKETEGDNHSPELL